MDKHCDKYLEEYLNGTLPADVSVVVEEHLKSCKECARLYEVMPEFYKTLPKMNRMKMSAGFYNRFWAELEARELKKKNFWKQILKPSLTFAFGILIFACYYFKLGPFAIKKETIEAKKPSIVIPEAQIPDKKHPENRIKTVVNKYIYPAKYNNSDYPVIIAMTPNKPDEIIARGSNDIEGQLYTIDPIEIDKLTGKLLESNKLENIPDYRINKVKLPGNNVNAENKIKKIISIALHRRGIETVKDDTAKCEINADIADTAKGYRITISAENINNDSETADKVTTLIAKKSLTSNILNTSQTQNWLISQFTGNNEEYSALAREELLKCGTDILPKLYDQLILSKNNTEAEKIAALIGEIGSKSSVAPLVRLMRDRRLADAAAIGLRKIGKSAVPELKKSWYKENRSEAHLRLIEIFAEIDDKTANDMIHIGLKDQFQSVRESAAIILSRKLDKAALPQLAEMTTNLDGDIRLQAVEAIAKYKQVEMVSKLSAIVLDTYESDCTRRIAINAIADIDNKIAVDEIVKISLTLLKENNQSEQLLNTLTKAIIKQKRKAVPAWINQLDSGNSQAKQFSARILTLIANDTAIDALIKATTDTDPMVRTSAIESLGIIKAEKALPAIKNALNDDNEEVVRAAVIAWKKITGTEANNQ